MVFCRECQRRVEDEHFLLPIQANQVNQHEHYSRWKIVAKASVKNYVESFSFE